jgi:hypothetical protein
LEKTPTFKIQSGEIQVSRTTSAGFLGDILRIDLKDPSTPPEQLRAADIIIKMCGWNAPEKLQVSPSDELMEVLKRLRGVS